MPEQPATVLTGARLLTFNVRLAGYPVDPGTRRWTARRQYVLDVIREACPSIIGFQEANRLWQDWLGTELGSDWSNYGRHPVQLFVDMSKWDLLNWWQLYMPSGLRRRYFVAAHLRSIKTGGTFLACDTHLAAHSGVGSPLEPNPSRLRHEQIRMIAEDFLPKLPDADKAVIMADLNSDGQFDGVRAIADDYGLKGLRRRMEPNPPGSTWRSFNGWKATQKGEQIDDILTAPGIGIRSAELMLTCPRVYPVAASDHNAWRATVEFETAVEPEVPLP